MGSRRQVKAEDFLYVFDRPNEPLFFPKGDASSRVLFNIPKDVLGSRFQDAALEVKERFGVEVSEIIDIPSIRLPDIRHLEKLQKNDNFSLFIPYHRELAEDLIFMFTGMGSLSHLMALVAECVERLNPFLLNYALSVALLHRQDTKHLDLPLLFESFPAKFFQASLISRARTEAEVFSKPEKREVIKIPRHFTASELDPEHRLWYFREDMGVNLHHWHWHLVYPIRAKSEAIVNKDRRGELFYYMHQQVIARYNSERFSNRLYRVERLLDWNQPIPEAYFPKLTNAVTTYMYAARFPNTQFRNINRKPERLQIDLHDMERWRDRIYEAIHNGFIFLKDGTQMTLMEEGGIDILGNLIESSMLSLNSDYYGDIHNKGHMFIAYIHDPDHRYLEPYGVMGESSTSMRDPVFYRWHAFIDDIFQEYKNRLDPYKDEKLKFEKIKIRSLEINSVDGTKDEFNTFWQRSVVNLSKGMDFAPRGDVLVEVEHLQHKTFTYTIEVENESNNELKGTVRIFLAPKYDERGEEMLFNDQRLMFIELDKFTWTFKPQKNLVERSSKNSSVTIPFERTFRNLDKNLAEDEQTQFNFCGCGWPEHMLIPKGTPEGYPCQLFVMISDYKDDEIEQNIDDTCADAASYCGIRDKKYPDKRNMGFPFDRRAQQEVHTLDNFIENYPNMQVKDINIKFTNETVDRYP